MKNLLTLFCILSSTTVWGFTNYTFGPAVFTGPTWHEEAANFVEINSGRFAGEELEISGSGWWVSANSDGLAWYGRPASGDGSGIYNIPQSSIVKREWAYGGAELVYRYAISSPQGWFHHTGGGFNDYANMNCARVIHTSSGGVAVALPTDVKSPVQATMIVSKGENVNYNVGAGDIVFAFYTRSMPNYGFDWKGAGPVASTFNGYVIVTNTIGAAFPMIWSIVSTNQFGTSTGPKFIVIQRLANYDTYETNVYVHSLIVREL